MVKKRLKIFVSCCLCISIGIVIGSEGKKLFNSKFTKVNTSPKKVVESYFNAYYAMDGNSMEKCLSPDLNDLQKLEYFGAKGSGLARDLISGYNEYLYYKTNPPTDKDKEDQEKLKNTIEIIDNEGMVRAFINEKLISLEDDDKYYKENYGISLKDMKFNIKFLEDEDYSNKDPNYIRVGIYIEKNINGQILHDDREVVLQNKDGKYYIVDI